MHVQCVCLDMDLMTLPYSTLFSLVTGMTGLTNESQETTQTTSTLMKYDPFPNELEKSMVDTLIPKINVPVSALLN